jgi:hypothetical protein
LVERKKNNKPVDGSMTDSRILCLIHSSAVAVLTQHKSLLGEIEKNKNKRRNNRPRPFEFLRHFSAPYRASVFFQQFSRMGRLAGDLKFVDFVHFFFLKKYEEWNISFVYNQ